MEAVKGALHSIWVNDGSRTSRDSDYMTVAVLAALIPLVRWFLHTAVFQPFGRRLIAGKAGRSGQRLPDKLQAKIDKFSESFWKLFVYGSFVLLTLRAVIDEPWFRDTSYFWRGYPNHTATPGITRVYLTEMAFYASSIGMLVFWETRRKDFWVMFTHHVATLLLIGFSWHLNFTRVGSMIMVLHDACDVLMETAKMAKYCGREALSSSIFVLFMLAWIALRLVYFPFWVIWSVSTESTQVLGHPVPHYHLFNGLLTLLAILHAYWFSLISKIAWRAVQSGTTDDVREEDD